MIKQSIQWMTVVAVACLLTAPTLGAGQGQQTREASFDLRAGARVATSDPETQERTRCRFKGEGGATISADGVGLELDELTQVDGDKTLTITPNDDFVRRGRSRVFMGTGSAVVDNAGAVTEFENVRIMVKLRGKGDRLRLIGKVKGINRVVAEDDDAADIPADVLHGVFRGQRVVDEAPSEE